MPRMTACSNTGVFPIVSHEQNVQQCSWQRQPVSMVRSGLTCGLLFDGLRWGELSIGIRRQNVYGTQGLGVTITHMYVKT
jgi:hypothetical protein